MEHKRVTGVKAVGEFWDEDTASFKVETHHLRWKARFMGQKKGRERDRRREKEKIRKKQRAKAQGKEEQQILYAIEFHINYKEQ